MPSYSTLKTLATAFAIALPCAQGIVVVPYEVYLDGPFGVPNDFVRFPVNESGEVPFYQGRLGVQLAIGTPPQRVWVAPHFYDLETYVRSLKSCSTYNENGEFGTSTAPIEYCEALRSGVFATNESSTFVESDRESFGTDTVTLPDAFPDLMNDRFTLGIVEGGEEEQNFVGETWGTLGLGPNSTFLQTFFPDNQQIGIYYTGGNSTHGKPPHSYPPRPLVIYELEFGGYNESHFTGEKFSQPIGPPLVSGGNPFTLNVTGVRIGKTDILGGQPFVAAVDLVGRTSNVLPSAVYDAFIDATGATRRDDMLSLNVSSLPKNPADWLNLTFTFSNGYSATFPQHFLVSNFSAARPDLGIVNLLDVEDPAVMRSNFSSPTIALNQLLWSSYIGIDHAAGEWWLAKSPHPWNDEAMTGNNTSEPKKNAAAGGIGENLQKAVASAAALAAAVLLFC